MSNKIGQIWAKCASDKTSDTMNAEESPFPNDPKMQSVKKLDQSSDVWIMGSMNELRQE